MVFRLKQKLFCFNLGLNKVCYQRLGKYQYLILIIQHISNKILLKSTLLPTPPTSSSIQQPHFYHLRHGVTYPKQWVQQRLLADSLIWDNFTKRTASVRSYGALVKWEDSQYNNPTLDFNHMSIYNLKDTHHKNWYLIFWYQPSRLKVYISSCRHNKKHAFRSWPEHLYMLGLHGILVWVNSGIMTFNVHSDQV